MASEASSLCISRSSSQFYYFCVCTLLYLACAPPTWHKNFTRPTLGFSAAIITRGWKWGGGAVPRCMPKWKFQRCLLKMKLVEEEEEAVSSFVRFKSSETQTPSAQSICPLGCAVFSLCCCPSRPAMATLLAVCVCALVASEQID